MSLEIIFEDDYILCVNKPNNVLVHHAFLSRNVCILYENKSGMRVEKEIDLPPKVQFHSLYLKQEMKKYSDSTNHTTFFKVRLKMKI